MNNVEHLKEILKMSDPLEKIMNRGNNGEETRENGREGVTHRRGETILGLNRRIKA